MSLTEFLNPLRAEIVSKLLKETGYSNIYDMFDDSVSKDPDKKVSQVLEEAGKAAGGEIKVASFVRFKLGEAAAE